MQNQQYRRLCTRIGIIVLLNTGLLQVLSTVAYIIASVYKPMTELFARVHNIDPNDLYYAFEQTLALFAYLVSFLIPVFVFMLIYRKDGREPMRLGVRIEQTAPLVIIASIGSVLAAAYLNSLMVSFIDFSSVFASDPLDTPVKVLMSFISVAIVPAVAEEFLFRGCILSNLLPYGKKNALIISALLFSLMHGNFAQFFYTFVAGLVLGWVYIETGSIWTSTFIHLFNNFYSITQQVVYERNGGGGYVNFILFSADIILMTAALAIGGWMLYNRRKKGKRATDCLPTHNVSLTKGEAVKGFFRPIMIVHISLSMLLALSVVLLVLLSTGS